MQENNVDTQANEATIDESTQEPVAAQSTESGGKADGRDIRDARTSRGNRNPRSRNNSNRRRKGGRKEEKKDPIKEQVIHIGRVAKTVKGGRNIRFTALVIAGDGEGRVGKGLGKAAEVPDAIRKGIDAARKNMISVPISGTTIPHEVLGVFGGGRVLLKPAPEGTGVIAGGPVRAICDMAGIKDVRTKSLGSNNPNNMVNAAFAGLEELSSLKEVAAKRGKTIKEIIG